MNKHVEALEGLKVLDLGQVIAGNFCSVLLADFGADVIKVERPDTGDGLRYMGMAKNGVSTGHMVDNRNKKSITLNLKSERGREIFFKLLKDADVVVENYAAGVMEKMGLGYEILSKVNPRVILARISGFGQYGPKKGMLGYDRIGVAYGGLAYISGDENGPPMRPGPGLADYMSGMFAVVGILMALYNRDVVGTGLGQEIELGLYESVFRTMENTVADYDLFGFVRERMGNGHPNTSPGNNYETKDGKWVCIACANDRVFARFANAIGRPEMVNESRYKTNLDRIRPETKKEIDAICREFVARHTEAECAELFKDVPYGVVLNIADIFGEEHYRVRENIVETSQDRIGLVKMQGIVPKLSRTPGSVKWAGPSLGAFNEEIYEKKLGFTKEEIEELKVEGII